MNSFYQRSRRRKLISDINFVPYIDITLVLLTIFMMTAPLQQSAVQVHLPVSSGAKVELKPQAALIISIQKDGHYYLSEKQDIEQPVQLGQLLSRVATLYKRKPQLQVYIKGDTEVDYGKVILVMAALKEAGVSHVGLLTSSVEP